MSITPKLRYKIIDYTDGEMEEELGLIIFVCEVFNGSSIINVQNVIPDIPKEKRKELWSMTYETFQLEYESKYLDEINIKIL